MLKKGQIVDRGSPQDLLDRYGRKDMEEVFLDIARDRRRAVAPACWPDQVRP
jgi:ABC-2 type transport system ATP-binding protein